MVAKKMPPKKMATRKAPVKKAVAAKKPAQRSANAAEKDMMDKKKTGTSKPLKSGAGYLKPASMASTKRVSKSSSGDLGSERGVVRQAAQRNRGFRKTAEEKGLDFGLINMTYRDSDSKLKNSVMNRKRYSKFPKKDVLWLNSGKNQPKQPKK